MLLYVLNTLPKDGIPSGNYSSPRFSLIKSFTNSINLSGLNILQINNLHRLSGGFLPHTPGNLVISGLLNHEYHSSVDNLNPEINPFNLGNFCSITIICSHWEFVTKFNEFGFNSKLPLPGFFSYTKSSYINCHYYSSILFLLNSSSSNNIPVVLMVNNKLNNILCSFFNANSAYFYILYLIFLLISSILLSCCWSYDLILSFLTNDSILDLNISLKFIILNWYIGDILLISYKINYNLVPNLATLSLVCLFSLNDLFWTSNKLIVFFNSSLEFLHLSKSSLNCLLLKKSISVINWFNI